MIGFFIPGANLNTLHADDMATFAKYYPISTGTNNGHTVVTGTCTIFGKVFRGPGTTTQQRCMEVTASLGNDPAKAVAMVSGAEVGRQHTLTQINPSNSDNPNSDCTDATNCSNYELRGLTPGTYTMGVHNFNDNGAGSGLAGFVLEPCHPALTSANAGDKEAQGTVTCAAGEAKNFDVHTN